MDQNLISRTSGDGMENNDNIIYADLTLKSKGNERINIANQHNNKKNEIVRNLRPAPGEHYNMYRAKLEGFIALPAAIPKGKIYHLVPRFIATKKNTTFKPREPKFIPFEPYKAAVHPIGYISVKTFSTRGEKNIKNLLDVNVLGTHISSSRTTSELNKKCDHEVEYISRLEQQKSEFQKELDKIKIEKDYFQTQLKFQCQVNDELKNMLVASVGEDLQTRVNFLTEDKLHLARALLDSANNLSSHAEQIEYLAGQCEVWRSKFLASSVMIEELARWKADLTKKNEMLVDSSKQMMHVVGQIRDMQLDTLKNLAFIAQLQQITLNSSNIIALSAECLNLSQELILLSGRIGMPPEGLINDLKHLEKLTHAEKLAKQAIEGVSQPLIETDQVFRAIFNKAFPDRSFKSAKTTVVDCSRTKET